MKITTILAVVLIAAITTVAVSKFVVAPTEAKKETAFERVMRTGTLRCGYIVSPPFLSINLSNGTKSGIAYEFMNAIGQELSLKIEWTEEAGWGSFAEGLNTGRYDAMCTPLWESGSRARVALFTKPLYDCDLSLVSRADDTRFKDGLKAVNRKDVTIATVEGDLSQVVRLRDFPLTKALALPSGIDDGQYFMNIITHKADVGTAFRYAMEKFNESSGNKLKLIGNNEIVQSFGTGLTVAHGEVELKLLFDSAINVLLKRGEAEKITSKYPGISVPSIRQSK